MMKECENDDEDDDECKNDTEEIPHRKIIKKNR